MTVDIFATWRPFHSLMEISQPDGDFIGKFATAKLGFEAAKWHTCAWRVVHSCENFHNLEADLVKFCFGDFATHFAAAKWALKVAKWHTCAWRVVHSCKNFHNLEADLAKFCFGDFATHFTTAKWALKVAKWHTCAWRVVRNCENFRNLAFQLAKLGNLRIQVSLRKYQPSFKFLFKPLIFSFLFRIATPSCEKAL